MLAELGGDLLDRNALPERMLDLQAFEVSEVLVLHLFGSFSCAMRDCNGGTKEAAEAKRWQTKCAPLPGEGGREEKTSP